MLEGYLVDLVPATKTFRDKEHDWRNNASSFWASGGERYLATRAALQRQFQQWAERQAQHGWQGMQFGIRTKTGVPIGTIGINWLESTHRLAMLGAKIGEPDYWGGGYGSDALLLIVDHAFNWLDIRKVWLLTTSMNTRVQRQMEKFGFTLEVRQRRAAYADGVWFDWLAYGLLSEEYPGCEALTDTLGLRERAAKAYGEMR